MKKCFLSRSGFTLIEMLIVIIVLGILAMIIIPQITVSTEDAKVKTLQTNLSAMRSAVELYYHQHANKYPGDKTIAGADSASDADSQTAFLQQLTRYTASNGTVGDTKTGTITLGPYIKGGSLPTNPFSETSTVTCDFDQADITVRTPTLDSAWRFFPKTGVLIANDSAEHAAY